MGEGIFSWPDFLTWEQASRDTIDFKRCYVDVAGDLVSGLVLSQIIYWFLPNRHGNLKVQVHKDGHVWLVKRRSEWWEECRVKPQQADRALDLLSHPYPPEAPFRGSLIEVKVFKLGSQTATHIRLIPEELLSCLSKVLRESPPDKGPEIPMDSGNYQNDNSGKTQADSGNYQNDYSGIIHTSIPSYTETTLIDYSNRFESNRNLENDETSLGESHGLPESVPVVDNPSPSPDESPGPTVDTVDAFASSPGDPSPLPESRPLRGEGNGGREVPFGLTDHEWQKVLDLEDDRGQTLGSVGSQVRSVQKLLETTEPEMVRKALRHLRLFDAPNAIQRFYGICHGTYKLPEAGTGDGPQEDAARSKVWYCIFCRTTHSDPNHNCQKEVVHQ